MSKKYKKHLGSNLQQTCYLQEEPKGLIWEKKNNLDASFAKSKVIVIANNKMCFSITLNAGLSPCKVSGM